MNKILAFIKIILVFVLLLLSITPTIFISTYVLTGFDKTNFINILQQMPAEKFWMLGLPIFFMCFICTTYLTWHFFSLGINGHKVLLKPKTIYHLEDVDINEKLSGLISATEINIKIDKVKRKRKFRNTLKGKFNNMISWCKSERIFKYNNHN
jgi:hypothetical protein